MTRATPWVERGSPPRPLLTRLDHRFYLLMSVLIVAAIAYGFSQTIRQNLINPSIPRPWILYVHAAVFFGWVALFVTQATLIQTRNVRWHRRLGRAGIAIGASIPVVGIATALAMARFNVLNGLRSPDYAAAFLIVPINDMVAFVTSFVLAVWWRRKPEYHRRLMLMATCCLTAAAFARFPFITIDALRWYGGVDALILLGVARDFLFTGNVHPVYRYGFPLIVLAQSLTMIAFLGQVSIWMSIGERLID